jgi:membrane-associated phospholipid phosphatase
MNSTSFWQLLTRLGEAQILLPVTLLAVVLLLRKPDGRPLALWWIALLSLAVLLTTVTKVAFIGWGIGWPALNFTGVSGHAMFAAATYPLLFATLASQGSVAVQRGALAAGCVLALAIGVSRVIVNAHSESEVLAGLLVGGATSAAAWSKVHIPRVRMQPLIPAAVALWLSLTPVHSPASTTHNMVTRLSLKLSGHSTPYTRQDMLRQQPRPLQPGKPSLAR